MKFSIICLSGSIFLFYSSSVVVVGEDCGKFKRVKCYFNRKCALVKGGKCVDLKRCVDVQHSEKRECKAHYCHYNTCKNKCEEKSNISECENIF